MRGYCADFKSLSEENAQEILNAIDKAIAKGTTKGKKHK